MPLYHIHLLILSRARCAKLAGLLPLDTLGFEPRAFRMRSGCDSTTPCALLEMLPRNGSLEIAVPRGRGSCAMGNEACGHYFDQGGPHVAERMVCGTWRGPTEKRV